MRFFLWILTASMALMLTMSGCGRISYGAARQLPAPQADLPAPEQKEARHAVLAGGCFWCVEAVFQQLEGVHRVVSGFAGGKEANAQYKKVSSGSTDHAESVRITYDPHVITYGELLQVYFATHHPTQLNRQGPDVGEQYRATIFYATPAQKRVARAYIEQLKQANLYDQPIATTLEPLTGFYPAASYHQDFVRKHPANAYVQRYALPKLEKLRALFPDKLASSSKP